LAELREALEVSTGRRDKLNLALYQDLLAELEAEGQDVEAALARIDPALSLAAETGEHWTDAFLYRIRGEILLKRDPMKIAPAEEAFLTAISIAPCPPLARTGQNAASARTAGSGLRLVH
jgi:hypothetical protein